MRSMEIVVVRGAARGMAVVGPEVCEDGDEDEPASCRVGGQPHSLQ